MDKLFLGIDLGTTTMSATVVAENGTQLKSFTKSGYGKDAEAYANGAVSLVDAIISEYNITAIGVTGQMHGVVLIDKNGHAVSRLYSWQEKIGDDIYKNTKTFTQEMLCRTNYQVPTGYGFNSLFYLNENHAITDNAVSYCTISDYLVMKLTNKKTPLIHSTNAASLGFFILSENKFDFDAIERVGLSALNVPEVSAKTLFVGEYKSIPVAVAIGDNQAAFLGSVNDKYGQELSVNCGTGSQISIESDIIADAPDVRPYIDSKYLLTGCAICGGSAYAMIEKFFAKCVEAFTGKAADGKLYSVMNKLALSDVNPIAVDTRFSGTRINPQMRGSISGIDMTNLTPESLTKGVICGMANELYELFLRISPECRNNIKGIVASGNALRMNEAFCRIVSDTFSLPLRLTDITEEAAYGASLFAKKAMQIKHY